MPDVIPHEVLYGVGGAGALTVVYTVVRIVITAVKGASETRKSIEETEALRMVGDRAVAEARNAGVTELAIIVGQLRRDIDNERAERLFLSEDLQRERNAAHRFRAAVIEFIGSISSTLPDIPVGPRTKILMALDKLKSGSDW